MTFDDWTIVSWPSVQRTGWFNVFLKGGLRMADNYYEHVSLKVNNTKVFRCATTLVRDALGHAGLNGIPVGKGSYNTTAQALATGYEVALTALMLFTFQGANTPAMALGLNLFWSTLTLLVPDKIVFVLGSGGNYLTAFNEWPAPVTTALFLGPNGTLLPSPPSAKKYKQSASFDYDPSNPAPTCGEALFQNFNHGEGSADQSPSGRRLDMLHFDGQPLPADLVICGEISASIVAGSTANNDFILRVVDQYPTGERYLVAEGVVRMCWRKEGAKPVPMKRGNFYTVAMTCGAPAGSSRRGTRWGSTSPTALASCTSPTRAWPWRGTKSGPGWRILQRSQHHRHQHRQPQPPRGPAVGPPRHPAAHHPRPGGAVAGGRPAADEQAAPPGPAVLAVAALVWGERPLHSPPGPTHLPLWSPLMMNHDCVRAHHAPWPPRPKARGHRTRLLPSVSSTPEPNTPVILFIGRMPSRPRL